VLIHTSGVFSVDIASAWFKMMSVSIADAGGCVRQRVLLDRGQDAGESGMGTRTVDGTTMDD
jgi:hypothetical protein